MQQYPSIAAHDAWGSNIFAHVAKGRVLRIVPRENESINETWLSDRDRFSYVGLQSDDRLGTPRLRVDGQWKDVDWQTALNKVSEEIRRRLHEHGTDKAAGLISANSTTEELFFIPEISTFFRSFKHRSSPSAAGF